MLNSSLQYSGKRWWGGSSNWLVWDRRRNLSLIQAWHTRPFTAICKTVCHIITLWSLAKFHCLENIVVIMQLKRSAADRKEKACINSKEKFWNIRKIKRTEVADAFPKMGLKKKPSTSAILIPSKIFTHDYFCHIWHLTIKTEFSCSWQNNDTKPVNTHTRYSHQVGNGTQFQFSEDHWIENSSSKLFPRLYCLSTLHYTLISDSLIIKSNLSARDAHFSRNLNNGVANNLALLS